MTLTFFIDQAFIFRGIISDIVYLYQVLKNYLL